MSKVKAFLTGNTGHKIVFSLIIAALIEVLIFLLSLPFVYVNIPRRLAQNCFSIAFDKWQMERVDKIVVSTENKDTVITDKDFIKKFVSEVKAPDSFGFQAMFGKCEIILYSDDKIIRSLAHSYTWPGLLQIDNQFPICASEGDVCSIHIGDKDIIDYLAKTLKEDGNEYYKYFTSASENYNVIDTLYILCLSFVIVTGYIIILIPVLLIVLLPGAIRRRKNKAANE